MLIDLKLGKLKYQDIGQMDSYAGLYAEQRKRAGDNPTMVLVLNSEKSEAIVKYSMIACQCHLFATKYLPTEKGLKCELEREPTNVIDRLEQIGAQHDQNYCIG